MTPGTPTFIDQWNPLLAQVVTQLETGTMDIPGQPPKAIITMRSATTTMTAILDIPDFRKWQTIMNDLGATFSDSGLHIAGNGQVPPAG